MKQNNCTIYISKFSNLKRKNIKDSSVSKKNNDLYITYCESDSIEKIESDINSLVGSNAFYSLKKRISSSFISIISVFVILIAFLSVSIYEDFLKKIIFKADFIWGVNDYISLVFVLVFFLGLLLMPSLLNGEKNEFKNILSSWFNKDIKRLKKLSLLLSNFDRKTTIHLYNFDLEKFDHNLWQILVNRVLNRFYKVNFYIRNDKKQNIINRLNEFKVMNIELVKEKKSNKKYDVEILLSQKEQKLYSLMQLCSTVILGNKDKKHLLSLELFEYCGKNFIKEEFDLKNQLVFGFQNFINRAFDDFQLIAQKKSMQTYFTSNVVLKNLEDEKKRLAYYLRNHIEEFVSFFENPISLLILYYYVKDIVLDKRRNIKILEKFISSIEKKQHYELIELYWFDIAGLMFDSKDINTFENSSESYYRKLSIESLNKLVFLFERSGYFEQAILVTQYLYEINPMKYALNISSLYERMGQIEKAYKSLPKTFDIKTKSEPNEIEVRYYQRKSAWVIINQRDEELKEEGVEALNSLANILFSHNYDNDPLWLWHYYNIKANLEEWNNNLDEAIKNYKKCLSIPTLGAFEYGGTFVNMAITYRCKYIEQKVKKTETIDNAIRLAKVGLQLKQSVGDRDEMPVVLHNYALNILYKIANSPVDEKLYNEVLDLSQEALMILDKTKSVKRLAMVLIENYIIKELLNISNSDIMKRLEALLPTLGTNDLNHLLSIYREFRKTNSIKKINLLE